MLRYLHMISTILPWIQIVLSSLLIIGVLLQHSGAEVGGAMGGGEGSFHHTKRGFEKFLFYATIVIAILFAASSFVAILK